MSQASLEAWARARGYWWPRERPWPPAWTIVSVGGVLTVFFYIGAETREFALDSLTAHVWRAAVDSGLEVDVGRCSACEGGGWLTRGEGRSFSCPACDDGPTGRDVRPLALLVCEAAPAADTSIYTRCPTCGRRVSSQGFRVRGQFCSCGWKRGKLVNRVAREALTVEADRLLAVGQPLGAWIAAWLRGECPACEGGGWVMVPWSANGLVKRECADCHGHGVLLGAYARDLESATVRAASCRNDA